MSPADVVLYSTAFCGWCERAKALLQRKNVTFRELRVDEDPRLRQEMLARTGGQRSLPRVFIGPHHIGGFDALYALERSGELDSLLHPTVSTEHT